MEINLPNCLSAVTCVKFIARKDWLVVGTKNGYIHVHNCETKMLRITSFRATDMYLKSLAVHPTKPYLLSPDHCGMKLWDWDNDFECIHNFEKEHSKEICQVAFNLNDTVASASEDHLVKVCILR
jgi:coatomer subunit beta'